MLALSRARDRVFLYQPDLGMAVPVVLNLSKKSLRVTMPAIRELEDDFVVLDRLKDVIARVDPADRELVGAAGNFSKHYSTRFKPEIDAGTISIADLRKLVEGDYLQSLKHREAVADFVSPQAAAQHTTFLSIG